MTQIYANDCSYSNAWRTNYSITPSEVQTEKRPEKVTVKVILKSVKK